MRTKLLFFLFLFLRFFGVVDVILVMSLWVGLLNFIYIINQLNCGVNFLYVKEIFLIYFNKVFPSFYIENLELLCLRELL